LQHALPSPKRRIIQAKGSEREGVVTYRIELAEYMTDDWVRVALVEKTLSDLETYVCIIKRMHPGCRVRVFNANTDEMVIQV